MSRVVPGIETAIVKWALSRTGARVLPVERGHAVIREAAARATERVNRGEIPVPDVSPPFEMEVEMRAPLSPEARATFERRGGYRVLGDRTLAFGADDMLDAYRLAALCGPIAEQPSRF